MTAWPTVSTLEAVLRFIVTVFFIIFFGLTTGYFIWGSRLGNLTQSLNTMILEQESLRARLASDGPPRGRLRITAEGEVEEDGLEVGSAAVLEALEALKAEIQYQGKLIDQQSGIINRFAESSRGNDDLTMRACRDSLQQMRTRLQSCMQENSRLQPGMPSPGPEGTGPAWPQPNAPVEAEPLDPGPRY